MRRLRSFLTRLYVQGWIFRLNQLVGWTWLQFFRVVYPDLAIGRRPHIWGRFDVMMFPGSQIVIGDDLHAVSAPNRSAIALFSRCRFTTFAGAQIQIGDGVGLNGTAITSKKRVEIGSHTMIAPNVIIVDSDFHAQWPPDARFTSSTAKDDREVVIGKNVWIGMNTIVLKGSRIGDNSIIGAGSLVTGEIPSNVIAGGSPAKVLRPLGPS